MRVLGVVAIGALLLAGPLGGGALVMTGALAAAADPCSTSRAPTSVAGVDLDSEQLANAGTITQVTESAGLPSRAAVIAVATALQESSLRNLDHGDAAGPDSRGLFQQRISYYGADVATDPGRATQAFLVRLVAVPHWGTIPLTVAAAAVQRPRADRVTAYAQWEGAATSVVSTDWRGPLTGVAGRVGSPTVCNTSTDSAVPGQGGLPAGYVLPTTSQGATAVRHAVAQLGKPYVWGGVGPNGYDCSGLTMTAWAAAGVAIPRTAAAQANVGIPIVSLAAMEPGDLIFIAGSEGTTAAPGHLGMYIGATNGVQYLVHAPRTGTTVQIRPVSAWAGQIVAIRRPADRAAR